MQNREDAGQAAQMTLLGAKFLDRLGRDTHQEAVHELLVAAEGVTQLGRHGGNRVKVAARQEFSLTLLKPLFGSFPLAFGTGPVAAGMVTPERLPAIVASITSSAQCFGAAGRDICQSPLLRRHHPPCVPCGILGTEAANDIRQFDTRFLAGYSTQRLLLLPSKRPSVVPLSSLRRSSRHGSVRWV